MDYEVLKKHFDQVASHESGIVVFKELMNILGVYDPSTVINPQTAEVNLLATAHNAALKAIWIKLRTYLSVDNLIQIEYDRKPKEPVITEKDLNARDSNSPSATSTKSDSTSTKLKRRDFQSESDSFARKYLEDLGVSANSADN